MTSPRSEPTFVRVADGTALAVHDLGGPHDPRAPVLLFSHATGFCGRSFGPMATELSSAYRCLAIDHRGHGLSTLAPDASLRWTTMGDDVVAVLDCGLIDPEQVVHGVGHSMGGATLVLAAAQRPGRIRSCGSMSRSSSPPVPCPQRPIPIQWPMRRLDAALPSRPSARPLLTIGAKAPLNQLRPDALEAYVMGGFALGRDGSVHLECEPLTEAQVFRGTVDSGAFEVLSKLDVPAAIVTGRAETFGPASFVSAIVDQWPSAVLDEQRHLGHFGPLEDPTAMANDLDAWVRTHA